MFAAAYIKHKDESGSSFEYVIGLNDHDREWRVTYYPNTKMIHCSCRRFEMVGLICCHSVKVFDVLDVKLLPENYILKRWTREARTGVVHDLIGNEVEEDSKLQSTERYRRLCQVLIRLANEASIHQSTFTLVNETMSDLYKKVMEMRLAEKDQEYSDNVNTSSTVSSLMASRGFKKKIGAKGSKRLKSWVELQSKQRKTNHKVKVVGARGTLHVSCSVVPAPRACPENPAIPAPRPWPERTSDHLSFTELLLV
ncbi:protein FAR1-RELATED SEQUENCE 3-like [Salvia hispanica]|uniref:protein FAR1-RELATED SEQUENCE 3-like n=1 Tax=Salvia hispanica TaxID=49212 RepID=UPI00200994B7|nr:protein FAR1-RELATED SEQUENCE 3-like [Salvia hispanica]